MTMRKIFLLAVLLTFFAAVISVAEEGKRTRFRGVGSAVGTDIAAMRMQALNNARAKALQQAGVTVKAGEIGMKSESSSGFVDYYSAFTESSARGIIVAEMLVRESDPLRVEGTDNFKIEMEIEAEVVIQQGTRDEGFIVSLEVSKMILEEEEPVTLNIRSSRAGYLTILNVYEDSLSVIFPNAIDKENAIRSDTPFKFPVSAAYELAMAVPAGKMKSEEQLIAVATKENIPFSDLQELRFTGDRVQMSTSMLTAYGKWIAGIPLDQRASDRQVIVVMKKR